MLKMKMQYRNFQKRQLLKMHKYNLELRMIRLKPTKKVDKENHKDTKYAEKIPSIKVKNITNNKIAIELKI